MAARTLNEQITGAHKQVLQAHLAKQARNAVPGQGQLPSTRP